MDQIRYPYFTDGHQNNLENVTPCKLWNGLNGTVASARHLFDQLTKNSTFYINLATCYLFELKYALFHMPPHMTGYNYSFVLEENKNFQAHSINPKLAANKLINITNEQH